MKPLTEKQQIKTRAKIYKILASIGFQESIVSGGNYWWRKISDNKRICVGFNVHNQCFNNKTDWIWQTSELNKEPLFGYSGSTSLGAQWGTVNRIIDITLDQIHGMGISEGIMYSKVNLKKAKEKILEGVQSLGV